MMFRALQLGMAMSFYNSALAAPLLPVSDSAATIPGHYIVVLHGDVPRLDKDLLAAHFGATNASFSVGSFGGFSGAWDTDTLQKILNNELVKYVEHDTVVHAFGEQQNAPWGLDRMDQRDVPLDGVYRYPDSAGQDVTAYILDTGIYVEHEDFGGRARFGWKADPTWSDSDKNGHGTHVASTVGGSSFGVAKKCSLVGVKVLSDTGSGSTSG
jgi:subtilisin family serine protease